MHFFTRTGIHVARNAMAVIEHDLRANAFRVCREEKRFALFRSGF
jgi:hypothetical protein